MKKEMTRKSQYCYYFLIIAYLVLLFVLKKSYEYNADLVTLFYGTIQINSICGILVEAQVAILICLVILSGKKGYYTAMFLGLFSIAFKTVPIILYRQLSSVTGMFMIAFGLGINYIIYRFLKTLTIQNDKLIHFNNELGNKQETLHKLAYYDYLTGLPNRRNVLETLQTLCTDQEVEELSLIVIDITNFKKINDLSGHKRGDILLRQLVAEWTKQLQPGDILGRIDGDCFALLLPKKASTDELLEYANTFKETVNQVITLGVNIGIATYPAHGKTAEEMLLFAEVALNSSKEHDTNDILFFDQTMYQAIVNKTIMESELVKAIPNNEFYLLYQPQYTADSNELRGMETLTRWNSKTFGNVSPFVFIGLAEETGFILELGEWILRTACTQTLPLLQQASPDFVLSINVSALQILHSEFVKTVKTILEETKFPANHLELEITESIYINEKEKVSGILSELKQLGISIALDDFGTNYSSLSYIKEMPIDILKIDKSFIDTIDEKNSKVRLVDAILSIGKLLDFKVVAEGVETMNQLEYLRTRDCDFIQGYLLSKPVPLDSIKQKLLESNPNKMNPQDDSLVMN